MAVIREDVVSIGFEVENDPLGSINTELANFRSQLGILETAEDGLKGIENNANLATTGVEGLANSIHAPPTDSLAKPIRDAGDAASTAKGEVSNLTDGLKTVGGIDMSDGMENLGQETQGATGKLQGLLTKGREFSGLVLKKAADGLTGAVEDPAGKIKDLVGRGKEFAKLTMDKGLSKLPPQAQLAVRGTSKLLGVGAKLSKLTVSTLVSGVKSLAPHATKAAKAVGTLTAKLGKGAAIGITAASLAVTGLGGAAIGVGANFETSMSQVAATLGMAADEANYSNESYALLANTAKEMGAATKFSAAESAEALNYMALAGYDTAQACTALPTVLNLASAGGMELAAASDMVTDSMSALGIAATQDNLTEFGDGLAKTAQKSNTSVAQLGEAVLTVGGTAKTLSGGTTELNTLLGIIADNGVKGAEGGTALRNIMLSLQAPTDTAAKKMKALGLEVYDAEGKMRPMNNILNDLNDSMGTMTDQQKQDAISTIFNKNDLKSVNALLANSGERFDELSGLIDDSSGAMANMAETMNNNLTGRVTEFKSAMEGAGIAIYESLGSGNMKDLVKEATGWVSELTKATESGGLTGLTDAFGGVLAKVILKASDMMPGFIDLGVSMIESLLDGIEQNENAITEGVTKGLMALISGVARILPKIVTVGVKILKSLVSGIVQNRGELTATVIGGIGEMIGGIVGALPDILNTGMLILTSLLQGLEQQLPNIITTGLTAIQNLSQGILQNLPAIVESGINIVMQLITGLVAALPTILTTGIQMVITLAMGLVDAIPDLIAVIPDIVGGIITALMSVNWLQLGLDIILGIGSGLVKGIKGLFDKGKDAGKEVGDGVAAGLNESTNDLAAAAESTTLSATEGLQPDTDMLSRYGADIPDAMALGVTSRSGELESKLSDLGNTTNGALANLAGETAPSMEGMVDGFSLSLQQMDTAAATQTETIDKTIKAGFQATVSDAGSFRTDFTGEISKIDLYQTGVNIVQGLNNGLISMKSTLKTTAQGIANDIKNTVNSTLDIHSPSRVMEASGEFTGLGLIKGLQNLTDKAVQTAANIGDAVAINMSPMRSRYNPDSSRVNNNRVSNHNVNNSPTFNLTLNGASASDSNERKVKRWIKSALKAETAGMMRTNPRLQEV